MSFPESSERTTYQTPQSGSITPTRTARTAFGGRGNPQPASMADTVSSWRQPHGSYSRTSTSRRNNITLSSFEPIEDNTNKESPPLRPPSTYSSLPNIYMPTNILPIPNMPSSSDPVATNNRPSIILSPVPSERSIRSNNGVASDDAIENICSDPIFFMNMFQDTVINDIRQVHSNIANSFSSIEQKYTRYFNTVNEDMKGAI
ncbi:hypothetical protein C8R42DRAFT_727374 [Lentinula raphanica]|nr:hypothetical protein C8R42DRAFT_727374 [Lentinula raphanica]